MSFSSTYRDNRALMSRLRQKMISPEAIGEDIPCASAALKENVSVGHTPSVDTHLDGIKVRN